MHNRDDCKSEALITEVMVIAINRRVSIRQRQGVACRPILLLLAARKRFCRQESGKADLGERQIVIKKCHLPDSLKISSPDSLEQVKRFQYCGVEGRVWYTGSVYSTLTSAPQLLVMLSRSLCNMKCKSGQRYDNYIWIQIQYVEAGEERSSSVLNLCFLISGGF